MKYRYLICLLLIGTLLCGCGKSKNGQTRSDDSWQTIYEEKTLQVGVYADNYPMTYAAGVSYAGYDIDLMNEIGKRLGLTVEYVEIDQVGAWNALAHNRVDCICSGFAYTEAKNEIYELTTPYLSSKQAFVLRSDSTIRNLGDLSGKMIGVYANGTAIDVLQQATRFMQSLAGIESFSSDESALDALLNGSVDVAVVSENAAAHYIQNGRALKYLTDISGNTESIASDDYVIAMKRGSDALKAKIEATLETMERDGLLDTYWSRWFSENAAAQEGITDPFLLAESDSAASATESSAE